MRGKPLSLAGDRLIPGRQAAERAEGLLAVLGELGDTSFCGLLKLEAGGSSKGLPAGCKG